MDSREIGRVVGRPRIDSRGRVRKTDRVYVSVGTRVRRPRGEQIYAFRTSLSWPRVLLAKKLHISPRSIVWWETGVVEPKDLAWSSFVRVRRNYQQRLRRQGKDLDGGPVMEK